MTADVASGKAPSVPLVMAMDIQNPIYGRKGRVEAIRKVHLTSTLSPSMSMGAVSGAGDCFDCSRNLAGNGPLML